MSKNPDMNESTAWAVATQQSHAAGKSPKGYGTQEGRTTAKEKFPKRKKEYVQTAKPKTAGAVDFVLNAGKAVGRKVTNADAVADLTKRLAEQEAHMTAVKGTIRNTALVGGGTAVGGGAILAAKSGQNPEEPQVKFATAEAIDGYSLAVFAGFSDEMQKISGAVGDAIKRFGGLVAGGNKLDAVMDVPTTVTEKVPRGAIGRMFGMAPKDKVVETTKQVVMPGVGPRVGSGIEALKNPATRPEALKVLGARGAAGAGAVGAGAAVSQKHKEHTNERLGRAYMAGARDMYAQNPGS